MVPGVPGPKAGEPGFILLKFSNSYDLPYAGIPITSLFGFAPFVRYLATVDALKEHEY